MRGLTLRDLADRIGTTPQTVQRLETANMTVSTDWLEKIAQALEVRITDLLEDNQRCGIPMLGVTGRAGQLAPGPSNEQISLDVPADDPVAVQTTSASGPYQAGSILVGNRYRDKNIANAAGRNAIVALKDGSMVLRRVILQPDGHGISLLSLDAGGDVTHGAEIEWAAPIVMTVTYE
ncbi:hypothetical protein MNBD_ALPHA09-1771 [hydrothermal vent metagenome]|uniref:HTH cro/C1-type domain-containing protein n=1 Tax=hydrothermal vent metagenome TaxID=652676 RepID=A0A3B0T5L2_9ZZZZ